jgi:hypothetical protein
MSKRKEKRARFRNQQKAQRQHLNQRRQREYIALTANLVPDRILYVPLDIGKNVHWMRAETGAARVVHDPKPLLTDQDGYRYWSRCLTTYLTGGEFDLVVIAHEPTGVYHESWSRAMLDDFAPWLEPDAQPHLRYRMLNPYQVKLERTKLTLRLRKTDPIDLWAMDSLLRQGQGNPPSLPDAATAQLAQYVFLARQAIERVKQARNDIIRHFDRVWPGAIVNVKRFERAHPDLPVPRPLVKTKPLERDTVRVLLHHCPNPYHVRQLGVDGLIDLFHRHETRCGPKTAQRILDCANRAMLSAPDIVETYLIGLEQFITTETHWLQQRQWAESHLQTIALQTPARHLISINGFSPVWAAYYLDLVGYPPRFDWADQLWAYVGFDPIENQSGDSNPHKPLVISRRGGRFDRHILTWSAVLVAGHHPVFGQTFIRAEQRGMGMWGAAIHTAHKLNRLCFRLIADDRPFRDDAHPDDLARWHTYWLAYRQHRREPKRYPDPGPWRPTTG